MNDNAIAGLADLFVALSDATRLRLLSLIGDGEVSVGYLADELGESQPKVSRHLAYLRNAGLVSTRRDGKWIYYSIDPPDDSAARAVLDRTLFTLGVRPDFGPGQRSISGSNMPVDSEHAGQHTNDIEVYLL